jgi:hypothetical protein
VTFGASLRKFTRRTSLFPTAMLARLTGSLVLLLALHASFAGAQEADPDLPQPFDPSAIRKLAANNPFNRIVAFGDVYRLTGVAYVQGKPIATLLNKETKQHIVVSEEPNAQGWKLTDATPTTEPKQAGVKLLVAGEEITLHYDPAAAAAPTQASSNSWRGGGQRRVVEPVDIHNLKPEDYLRKDKDGKEYVRGSIYLPQADRDYYYNDMSRDAHDKYRSIMESNRERMLNYNPDQRAAFSKKIFDHVVSEDKKGK